MTDSSYTHIMVVVDRSGSMWPIKDDMTGALNAFFAEQAKGEGKCLVDYAQFDTSYELVYENREIDDAKAVLDPAGGTALLDAIGKSATDLGKKFADMDENQRPGTVIVAVVTDGDENSSVEWTAESVKALIEKQESEYNWDFTFLGANMDAVSVGASFGFKPSKSLTYDTGNTGVMASTMSSLVTRTRSGDKTGYTQEERDAQK